MKIHYCSIHQGAQFQKVGITSDKILKCITLLVKPSNEGRSCIKYDDKNIHLERFNGISYICVTDVLSLNDSMIIFEFLKELQNEYPNGQYLNLMKDAVENFTFQRKLSQVFDVIEETKNQLQKDIDALLDRGEKLEEIVAQAELLTKVTFEIRNPKRTKPPPEPILVKHHENKIEKNSRTDEKLFYVLVAISIVTVIAVWVKVIIDY